MIRKTVLLALLLFAAVALTAQSGQFEMRFAPRFWGATVGGRYILAPPTTDGTETAITGLLSGAYEGVGYYRLPDGALFSAGDSGYTDGSDSYDQVDLVWELGIQQGILSGLTGTADRAVVFSLYRGQYDLPFQESANLFFDSSLPEASGSLRGSLVTGIAYSTVATEEITGVRSGLHGELSVEWGPAFLHNQLLANANYTRGTLTGTWFLPITTVAPVGGRNVFAAYLAAFGIVDWSTGPEVPLSIRNTTGGRSVRGATGGSVRGYESGRFDATLKAIGNLELRMTLPSIVLPSLVPGVVIFTDCGYFQDSDLRSPLDTENSGLLLSSGLGLSLNVLDAVDLVFYTNYLWTEATVDGSNWVPFGLGFGYHF